MNDDTATTEITALAYDCLRLGLGHAIELITDWSNTHPGNTTTCEELTAIIRAASERAGSRRTNE